MKLIDGGKEDLNGENEANGHGFGYADYLLSVDGQAIIGVLEVKPLRHSLARSRAPGPQYASGLPSNLTAPVLPLPLLYLSTSTDTRVINPAGPRSLGNSSKTASTGPRPWWAVNPRLPSRPGGRC